MQIKITIQDADVQASLLRLKDKVGNLKAAMDEIGQRYERSVLENFANQSSPDGKPWQPNRIISNHLAYIGIDKGGKAT